MQLKIQQNLKDPKINTKFLKIISLAYSKNSQTSKMERFAVKNFCKTLHLRCLTWF